VAVAVATRAAAAAAAATVISVPVSLTARTAKMWLTMIYGRSHAGWSW
jgi:hypothetical protein